MKKRIQWIGVDWPSLCGATQLVRYSPQLKNRFQGGFLVLYNYSLLHKLYFVYILYSPSKDKYYIGQTQDLQERLNTHNIRKNLGTNDWQLKYSEKYNARSEAMLREIEIKKKKSRKYLEHLISSAG